VKKVNWTQTTAMGNNRYDTLLEEFGQKWQGHLIQELTPESCIQRPYIGIQLQSNLQGGIKKFLGPIGRKHVGAPMYRRALIWRRSLALLVFWKIRLRSSENVQS